MSTTVIGQLANSADAVVELWRREDRRGLAHHETAEGSRVIHGWRCTGCRQSGEVAIRSPESEAEASARRSAEAHAKMCARSTPLG
ncbi:hypothetical protein [Streptomyces sp. NPDC053079]|uniref:hypothetical protein n=1 Tax=Streptomyces sp. NPDC053079 TaxID=3365697 RepID=UPI0037D4C543